MKKRVALVTGAAAGIGRQIGLRLSRDGIAIGVLDRELDGAARVADEIVAAGGDAVAVAADISQRHQVDAAVAEVRRALGPVTIVVNNAGISAQVPFQDLTDEQWDTMMAVNLKGTFIVTQVVLPDMIAAGGGRIVNISSSSAQSGAATMAHYSASKGGVIALTKTLAQEFGRYSITANNIAPRFVMNTVMSEKQFTEDATRDAIIKAGPIRRQGEPEDIAGACAWLVSDEAGYVTGQTIGVNGGRYI
ncbi:SDR family NAD(P)-dependent oxidoreductase [Mycolicibacterium arenosum]|uniref:3-oxoacyl-[acyl-carrier-protein] reductase MabA n=1 Tax=Mycolicibacterium arenosum TaxID=2952157 RepID=A0ABT1M293_9MYCO|nr:SDR family NAD(P)-dependent oxidoreductase [Mycolicibacterium sp. CAU 1645]MCP9273266.1 SDR family oxidoreductase [Mycolicibacterium sp. CAU 1645]